MRAAGRRLHRRLSPPLAAAGVAVLALAGTAACGDTGPGGEDSAEPSTAARPGAAAPDTAAVRGTGTDTDTAAAPASASAARTPGILGP